MKVTEQELYTLALHSPLLLAGAVFNPSEESLLRELIVMFQHWWKRKQVLPVDQGNTTEGPNPSGVFKPNKFVS